MYYKPNLIFILVIIVMCFWRQGCRSNSETARVREIYRFLENFESAEIVAEKPSEERVAISVFSVDSDKREVLFEQPDSEVVFGDVTIKKESMLKFAIGIKEEAWDKPGDGVLFQIHLLDEESRSTLLFSKYLDPKHNIADRVWFEERIDVSRFAGKDMDFLFKTTGGPKGDTNYDWAGWANPEIITVTKIAVQNYPINLEQVKYNLIKMSDDAESINPKTNQYKVVQVSTMTVNPDPLARNYEERQVILLPNPMAFVYDLSIPENAFLEFGIGLAPESVDNNMTFEVYADEYKIFSRTIEVGRWYDEKVDLKRYGGERVKLKFNTVQSHTSGNDNPPVTAGWSNMDISEVVSLKRNLSSKELPNVILIVIDTQRADHLSCYGYDRETSPNLDKFAETAVLFENAISQSSWTWPATATILTGLYPYAHGVTNDDRSFLAESNFTLPELLQMNHFTTFGISANPLVCKAKNFDQGFEIFVELPAWMKAEKLNQRFFEWLEFNKEFQFFAYLHYMDPHDPYNAPGDYYNMFDLDYSNDFNFNKESGLRSFERLWKAVNFRQGQSDYTGRDMKHLAALYDGEIRYWDNQFGALLDELKRQDVLDNTIILITSDHGEEFLEHGRIKHGMHLYDETIRVPLIIWTPKLLKGSRITEQVETLDIYPTVCKILDIVTPNVIQGESLFPWTRVRSNQYAYSRTEHAYVRGKKGRISKSSIRTNEWKFISTPSENKYELYSIKADRDESNNIFGNHPMGNELRTKLEDWVLIANKNVPDTRTGIDKKTLKKLRSLGYIR